MRYRNLPVKTYGGGASQDAFIPECIAAGGKNRTCGRNEWERVGLLVSRCGFAEAGKRTARFTSPHLVRVTERFSFDGQEADDALFLEAFEAVKASYVHFEQEGLGRPTYFEYLFLMFMWMVRRKKPEYVILERGSADAGCNELHRASSAYGHHFNSA